MEFLKFIFSSPWIWLGFLILVCCVLKRSGSGERPPRKAESSHVQDERRQLAGAC